MTNQLGTLHGWFWTTGPQYRQLAGEAKLRRDTKALGPPAYRFTLTRVQVLAPSPRHRILRGRVRVTRPGERGQSYGWDVWMRRGGASGDRWRLWTVNATRGPRARSAIDPVVVAAGDIAEVGGHQQLTSDRVLELDPDRVLLLGDNQYWSGTLAEYRRLYDPTWGRFKARTRPVPGNHEYQTPRAAGYFAYFARLARPKGRSYYSFNLGGWHLIALNSSIDHGPGSAQERWLRADLLATAKRCILAYWHFPRFSSGAHQGNWGSVDTFWNDLYDARADVVLNGHEHSYERFARQTAWAKASRQGIRQFVVGTGGADTPGFACPQTEQPAPHQPHPWRARVGPAPGQLPVAIRVRGRGRARQGRSGRLPLRPTSRPASGSGIGPTPASCPHPYWKVRPSEEVRAATPACGSRRQYESKWSENDDHGWTFASQVIILIPT